MVTGETGDVATKMENEDAAADTTSDAAASEAAGSDNGQASDTPKGGKQTKYGKGFVYLGLGDCDEALRKIDAHEKRMPVDRFAKGLGHNAPKGRFLHKIDALKSYGLIESDTSESVTLSQLADDMLYGAAKAKARTTAFLNYQPFKKLYVDFPKAHDNARADIINFIKAKLGIVNDVNRFLRLFIESAGFAGLLEGEPDSDAKIIRLRAAPTGNGATPESPVSSPSGAEYAVMPADEVDDLLEAAGLTEFKQRSEVRQRTTGQYKLEVGEGGKITIEINRPIQITVRPENLVMDLPKILEAMHEKGLQA